MRRWMTFWIGWLLLALPPTASALPEDNLRGDAWKTTLEPFFRSGIPIEFRGDDGLPLKGVRFPNPTASESVLFLPGFSEPWLKYIELLYDIHRRGYEILTYDHRGQGANPRLARNTPDAVHLERFEDHVSDLKRFLDLAPRRKIHVLAHSMGGAVVLDWAENHSTPQLGKMVLNAPMLAIRTDPFPRPLARVLASFLVKIGLGERFAPTKGPRDPERPFEANGGTSSRVRYDFEQRLSRLYPDRWVGGPTNAWVKTALEASTRIARDFQQLQRPVTLLVPTEDSYAVPEELIRICRNPGTKCNAIVLEGARHEVFAETDAHRNRAFEAVLRSWSGP
jgi:lysophospholipase